MLLAALQGVHLNTKEYPYLFEYKRRSVITHSWAERYPCPEQLSSIIFGAVILRYLWSSFFKYFQNGSVAKYLGKCVDLDYYYFWKEIFLSRSAAVFNTGLEVAKLLQTFYPDEHKRAIGFGYLGGSFYRSILT